MRVRIRASWKINAPFRIYMPETVIQVTRQSSRYELCWNWCDGTGYALEFPQATIKQRRMQWSIRAGEETICLGRMIHPTLLDPPLRAFFPHIEWEFDSESVRDEAACYGGVLRRSNGSRLAVWRHGRVIRVVYSGRLPPSLPPILCGIVLARLYDPDPSG
jgi:hypothetical protein